MMGKVVFRIIPLLFLVTIVLGKSTTSKIQNGNERAENPITLDDILTGKYSPKGYSGYWSTETLLEYKNGSNLWTFDIDNEQRELKFDASIFASYGSFDYTFSADKNFILVKYGVEAGWRHSQKAFFDVYDVATETTHQIFPKQLAEQERIMLFKWAPSGNSFAYVHNGDIYYRSTASQSGADQEVRLTTNGNEIGPIFNGHTDWVYEEEMFGNSNALWFSSDSKFLSFVEFNDSSVQRFEYPMYGEPGDFAHTYPKWIELYYPKAGTQNPTAKMYIVDLSSSEKTEVAYSDEETDNRHYIATSMWRTPTSFFLIHMNRKQNIAVWYECQASTKLCTKLTTPNIPNQSEPNGWVDVSSPRFSADMSKFLIILPKEISTKNNLRYRQIHIVDLGAGTIKAVMNMGISVDSILGWNEVTKTIYFSATETDNPSATQIYSIAETENSVPTCITCSFENSDGVLCKDNRVSFSPEFTRFIHFCSGPGIPEVNVRKLVDPTYEVHLPLETNGELRDKLQSTMLPEVRDFEVEVGEGDMKFTGRARLYLPPGFDENKQYPLLIDVYAGPDSQKISESYGVTWSTSLVSDKNVIIGHIDGRGSGRQSREQLFTLNKKLGTVEIEDQIAITAELIKQLKFINPEETAIWGWSYGGYATSMVMATDINNVFKCGIAVAPVTSWLYYDTIYTERYMGLPTVDDNLVGYNLSQVTVQVENFRNKKFLLVHGNADDNVHYQQSMILSRALEQNDIMFSQLSYPNEDHSIAGPGMRKHLYHSLEKFLYQNCFALDQHKSSSISLQSKISSILLSVAASLLYFRL